MAITRTRIFSIVDAEFDRVFNGSVADLNDSSAATYPFAELGITSQADQKTYLRAKCEDMITQPNAFCWKAEDDGLLLNLSFGLMVNGLLDIYYYFAASDASGSKAYIHNSDNLRNVHDFFVSQGINKACINRSEKGSKLKDFWASRFSGMEAETSVSWDFLEESSVDEAVKSASKYSNYSMSKITYTADDTMPSNTD